MKKAPLVLSLAATLTLGAIGAAQTPATVPSFPADAHPAQVPSVLIPASQPGVVELSDRPFISPSGGISVRYPAGSKALHEVASDEIMEFRDEARDWTLVLNRRSFPTGMNLTAARDGRGKLQPGVLEQTGAAVIQQYGNPSLKTDYELMKKGLPGLTILRQDLTNLGNYDVGMLVFRYTKDAGRRLAQTAIVEANDQLFYTVSLNTPGRREADIQLTKDGDEANEDPGEVLAVDTFRKIIESVSLLDRAQIRADQEQRLFRTRSLFQNWTERLLLSPHTLIPEQYQRILREDKPNVYTEVGCRYIVMQPDHKGLVDFVKVGVHTIFSDVGPGLPTVKAPRFEKEEWMSVSVDRKHEDWSRQTVVIDGQPRKPGNPYPKLIEFGTSDLKTSRFLIADSRDPKHPDNQFKQGTNEDPHQPWMGVKDHYDLGVQYVGTMGNQDPVSRQLPVFYLPQALDAMLPRLIPPNEVKTYMMATYVGVVREVMLRYVEVKPIQQVTLAGRTFQAIPIDDHIGIEGTVTTNYVSPTGEFLGSENKDSKIIVIPSSRETIARIWPNDKLHLPGDPGAAPNIAPQSEVGVGTDRSPSRAPGQRGGITVGPSSPFDVNAPRDGVAPGQAPGDSILPDPVLPERPGGK